MPLRTLGPEHILEVIQAAIVPVVLISGVGLLLEWNLTGACAALFVSALLCLLLATFVFVRERLHSLTALDLSIQESCRPPSG